MEKRLPYTENIRKENISEREKDRQADRDTEIYRVRQRNRHADQ